MSPRTPLSRGDRARAARAASVAALVLAIVVLAMIVRGSGHDTYEMGAVFDDVRGLIVGADVRAGAVKVGSVTGVAINARDEPYVTMRVTNAFRMHRGAIADIRLASNVGAVNRTVELTQGDVTAPRLAAGTVLRGASTDQPVNFDQVMDTLDPPTRRNLGRLLGGLDASVAGRGPDVDRLLSHSGAAFAESAGVLAQVNRDGQALRTLVAGGDRVLSALARRPQDLGDVAQNTARLLQVTAGRQQELRTSVRVLAPALSAGRRALDALADSSGRLRTLVRGLPPVLAALGPLARVLPKTLTAAAPFVDKTARLVREGPQLLTDSRPTIRAARPIATDLAPVIAGAQPLADVLQAYIPETVGAFQNFGATAGTYDANGHVLNVATGSAQLLPLSSAAAGEIPLDACDKNSAQGVAPGLLQAPFIRVPGVNECQPWTDFERPTPTSKQGR